MVPVEITSRQFHDDLNAFFDMADNGKQIVIKRGRKPSYTLAPVNDDDLYFTPEMETKIERAMQQYEDGQYTVIHTEKELHQFLDGL